MASLELNISITKEECPMLFKLKKRDRDKLIKQIFIIGYRARYPTVNDGENCEDDILSQLLELKSILSNNNSNTELKQRIDSLECSLEKLIGLSNSSMKKGEFAENVLENIFETRYGDIQFKNMAQTNHCADAWLTFSDDSVVMVESKNYTNKVNKDEVIKMQKDMITNHILYGIFVSWNSSIQNMREFDIHIFSHNGETYTVVMISNLAKDISRLDIGIQVIRKVISNYQNISHFPWLVKDIKDDLTQLNEIIKKNYMLRDKYCDMEMSIKANLSEFYHELREYQYKLNHQAKQIIGKIDSTMKTSLSISHCNIETLIEKYKGKKSIFPILSKVCDSCQKFNWTLIDSGTNLISVMKADDNICQIKISNKKLSLNINNGNLKIDINKDSDVSDCLEILKVVYNKNLKSNILI